MAFFPEPTVCDSFTPVVTEDVENISWFQSGILCCPTGWPSKDSFSWLRPLGDQPSLSLSGFTRVSWEAKRSLLCDSELGLACDWGGLINEKEHWGLVHWGVLRKTLVAGGCESCGCEMEKRGKEMGEMYACEIGFGTIWLRVVWKMSCIGLQVLLLSPESSQSLGYELLLEFWEALCIFQPHNNLGLELCASSFLLWGFCALSGPAWHSVFLTGGYWGINILWRLPWPVELGANRHMFIFCFSFLKDLIN